MSLEIIKNKQILILLAVVVCAFAVSTVSLFSVKISSLVSDPFFFEKVVPITYWISVLVVLGVLLYSINKLDDKKTRLAFIFSSIILMILIRYVFPLTVNSVITYEPDSSSYISIVNNWYHNSLDLGVAGNYQHDYPLSFLTAFVFAKFGVNIELFFRFAPLFIYVIDFLLLYFIIVQVTGNSKTAAIGVFLFSFCPLNYWLAVHFCPDLMGSLLFFISLYLLIMYVKTEKGKPIYLIGLLISIFLLILAHHLSTLYFIVLSFGLAFTAWYFKSPFKGREIKFLLIGIYTYTLWFVYGTLVYPQFFNVYTYLSQTGSTITLSIQAGIFDNISFAAFPTLIFILVGLYLKETFGLRNVLKFITSYKRITHPAALNLELSSASQYSSGFFLIFGLFFVGLAIPNIFALRVLEIVMVGLYPIAAISFEKLTTGKLSRNQRLILYIVLCVIVVLSIHRYYSQIEGRVAGR